VLGAEYSSRFNGLYLSAFFVDGAIGSAVGGWAFAVAGWHLASWIGFAFPILALAFFLTEFTPAGTRDVIRRGSTSRRSDGQPVDDGDQTAREPALAVESEYQAQCCCAAGRDCTG
jgi:MFS family permease